MVSILCSLRGPAVPRVWARDRVCASEERALENASETHLADSKAEREQYLSLCVVPIAKIEWQNSPRLHHRASRHCGHGSGEDRSQQVFFPGGKAEEPWYFELFSGIDALVRVSEFDRGRVC